MKEIGDIVACHICQDYCIIKKHTFFAWKKGYILSKRPAFLSP